MTQSNPLQSTEKNMSDAQFQRKFWGVLAISVLALFAYAYALSNLLKLEPTTAVYIKMAVYIIAIGLAVTSFVLSTRRKVDLALTLIFYYLLIAQVANPATTQGRTLNATFTMLVVGTLMIGWLLPRSAWRRNAALLVGAFILAWIFEWINPSWRIVTSSTGAVGPAVAIVFSIILVALVVREAWNRSYTVGRKLLIAFGALGLLSLVVGLLSNFGLSNVTNAYDHALEDGSELRATSLRLSNELLTARRHEKDFLLLWKEQGFNNAYTEYALPNDESIVAMRRDITLMFDFAPTVGETFGDTYPQAQYTNDLNALRASVDGYERNFQKAVQLIKEKGFQDEGLEGEFRDAVHAIEDRIYDREGLEPLVITMLSIRRHEKDYLLRGDQTYVNQTHDSIDELKRQISASDLLSAAEKAEMRTLADQYIVAFDALVENDFEIAVATQEFNFAARTMEPIVEKLTNAGAEMSQLDVSTATTANVQMRTLTTITMVVALLAAVFISLFLSRQISRPVVELTNTAQVIAGGKFDVHADVSSADEIGTLAQTFNTMTERLGVAFEDVRRRSLQVQTAAEVSRRLSAVTDPRQLAVEVVEQVQRAFNYYYAQIYLLDEAGENLVIAGGTGEAGASMLARKHSVPRGRGLVGRAADTNSSVLVPDVLQEEGWLPNDMLPETRTEAAVPISFGGQVYGVLDVQHSVVNGLTVDDVTLLESLAGQAAISLQNARSYEQSRRQAEFESLTNMIGRRIQNATSIEETLQTAIRELGTAIGASRVKANISAGKNGNTN